MQLDINLKKCHTKDPLTLYSISIFLTAHSVFINTILCAENGVWMFFLCVCIVYAFGPRCRLPPRDFLLPSGNQCQIT